MWFLVLLVATGVQAQNTSGDVPLVKNPAATDAASGAIPSKEKTTQDVALIKAPDSAFGFTVKSIDGKLVNLADYKGKPVMIVNVASRCGFTPQYKDLETLYLKFKEQGFVILGFPSNDFGGQEPGTNADIANFCKAKYDVSFPLFEKGSVSGATKQPLYKFLTEQSAKDFQGEIAWNFTKFLLDRNGHVVARFSSSTRPMSPEVIKKVDELVK